MAENSRPNGYDDAPIYTIKTVVHVTGITPATLRAWERRYGVLAPGRSEGGYRLYSERDIATLLWLKHQVGAGVAISRAVALLEMHHQAGEAPELNVRLDLPPAQLIGVAAKDVRSTGAISEDLLDALLAFREGEAETLLGEAFGLHPVEQVLEQIIAPTLAEIGERWHNGEATVVQEHFATAFLRRRLTALFDVYGNPPAGSLAITGSAPTEWHDVGILLVSLTLRRHGWRVIYLGQNVPADHLVREIGRQRPNLVCLSATTPESAKSLVEVADAIRKLPEPRPRLALGGRAFNYHPELRLLFPAAYFGATASELMTRLAGRDSISERPPKALLSRLS
jgi:MerR family transcriptional regulator, light-induced transcriptional regulator